MEFYLNGQRVGVEVCPIITETQDETLDTASCVLEATAVMEPYAPSSRFSVKEGNETVAVFEVQGDSVSLMSENPPTWKHSLTLIQSTRKLHRCLVRNSVFSQPANPTRESVTALSVALGHDGAMTPSFGSLSRVKRLYISPREKIKDAYVQLDVQLYQRGATNGEATYHEPSSLSDMNGRFIGAMMQSIYQNAIFANFSITGGEGSRRLDAQPGEYGKRIRSDQLRELLSNGNFSGFYLSCGNVGDALSPLFGGTANPSSGISVPYAITAQMRIVAEVYYNTVWDVLDKLRRRQLAEDGIEWFRLPQSGELRDLLKSTVAPEFTFTQCTMHECLSEIFRLFDATFTLDEDNVLGIEYLNGRRSPVGKDLSGASLSVSDDRRANGLTAYYQDARANETFPSKGFAYTRGEDLGVPGQFDHNFIVPHDIQSIRRLRYLIPARAALIWVPWLGDGKSEIQITNEIPLDITAHVVEESIRSTLNVGVPNHVGSQLNDIRQYNTVHYRKGGRSVAVSDRYGGALEFQHDCLNIAVSQAFMETFGCGDSSSVNYPGVNMGTADWANARFSCEYVASVDGRVEAQSSSPKAEGTLLVNQSSGAVDLAKLGLNMQGLSMRMGEPSMTATHEITSWADRVRKGQTVSHGGATWVANVCEYTIMGDRILGRVRFAKNHNALSQRVRVDREKRLSSISREMTAKSEAMVRNYVYFSCDPAVYGIPAESSALHTSGGMRAYHIFQPWCDGSLGRQVTVATATAGGFSYYLPMVRYGAGNAMFFEMSYDSPISAGNSTSYHENSWFDKGYFTKAVRYADDYGFLDSVTISLGDDGAYGYEQTFPLIHPIPDGSTAFSLADFEVLKQPNEVMAVNYGVFFLPHPSAIGTDFVSPAFVGSLPIVSGRERAGSLWLTWGGTYTELDSRAKSSNRARIASVQVTHSRNDTARVDFSLPAETGMDASGSWAVLNDDGEVLIASNRSVPVSGGTATASAYFAFRANRL